MASGYRSDPADGGKFERGKKRGGRGQTETNQRSSKLWSNQQKKKRVVVIEHETNKERERKRAVVVSSIDQQSSKGVFDHRWQKV